MATIEIKSDSRYREVPYGGTDGQVLTKIGDTDEFQYQWTDATNDYDTIKNKPTLEGVEISGDMSAKDLGLQSELTDVGENQNIKTINGESILGEGDLSAGKVDDVKVNGESILDGDKIANIDLTDYATLETIQIGKTFITNTTIGNLEAGTQINSTDTLGSILYNILYKDMPKTVTIFTGATDNVPSSLEGLFSIEVEENKVVGLFATHISAGNPQTEQGQYPCVSLPNKYNVNTWVAKGAEAFKLPFSKVKLNNDYSIYYLDVKSYDEDLGGIDYILEIMEA